MNQAELLRHIVETLDTLGIDHMVSGSHASIYYGEPQQGGSDRHLRDIAGMLRVSGAEIDTRYIDEWAQRLGVDGVCRAVRERGESK